MDTASYYSNDGSNIMTMDFGYNNSWLISSGKRSAMDQLDSCWDLKGYYTHLQRFLDSNESPSIVVSLRSFSSLSQYPVRTKS